MSTTTISNPVTTELSETLRDYDIKLTGAEDLPAERQQQTTAPLADHEPAQVENPPGWDSDHRGVPFYRPVNTDLDRSQRPWGANSGQATFIFIMLHGVWLTKLGNWAWTNTGGRINNTYFRWKVGGEF